MAITHIIGGLPLTQPATHADTPAKQSLTHTRPRLPKRGSQSFPAALFTALNRPQEWSIGLKCVLGATQNGTPITILSDIKRIKKEITIKKHEISKI